MIFMEALMAYLSAATGMSATNAGIVIAAVNAGWMLVSILTFFSGLGLTMTILRTAAKQTTTKAAIAW
ncbi:MAG: hypothetical protein N2A99_03355 [Carnobacterium alterfunditum]